MTGIKRTVQFLSQNKNIKRQERREVDLSKILTCVRLVFIIAMSGALGACATAAQPGRMVPESALFPSYGPDSPLRDAIAISKVGGGEKTNPLLVSKVGDEELHETLRLSLKQCGLLSTSDVAAPFRLEVFLIELKQPRGGLTAIVDSVIRYKLTRSGDDQVVYDDIITASYKATVGDALYGPQRLKLANEGSIRANIATFLENLHSLNIMKLRIQ
jgi:hypothetical protein